MESHKRGPSPQEQQERIVRVQELELLYTVLINDLTEDEQLNIVGKLIALAQDMIQESREDSVHDDDWAQVAKSALLGILNDIKQKHKSRIGYHQSTWLR